MKKKKKIQKKFYRVPSPPVLSPIFPPFPVFPPNLLSSPPQLVVWLFPTLILWSYLHSSSIADFILFSHPFPVFPLPQFALIFVFSQLILHNWVKTTVGFNRANLFEADIVDLIKDVSTARWRPPQPSTGIKDVFTGGWRLPSP